MEKNSGQAFGVPHSAPPRARKQTVPKHALLLLILLPLAWFTTSFRSPWTSGIFKKSFREQALRILEHHPLIDGHNDLASAIAGRFSNKIYDKNFTDPFENGGMSGQVDLPRIDSGRYGGAFWSAFWPCPSDPFDFSDEAYDPTVRATLHQLDLLKRLSSVYPYYFPPTPSSTSALSAFRKYGAHISPLAIEGLHQIGNSYSNLRLYHDLGVRYATLNWNCHNIYSDAAAITFFANGTTVPSTPLHGGISIKGREMILEMNRLGMIVDLSHVSADTMRDALVGEHNSAYPLPDAADGADRESQSQGIEWKGSLAPPIFSHSSVRAICPHPRNVPDDVLDMVKARNSVVMINFSPDFISCHYEDDADPKAELPTFDPDGATLGKVADHIMYIGEKIGFAHVGIGSDFDGIFSTPVGLEGVDKMPDLVAELLRRGVSAKDVVGVVGGNVLRVWHEVEKVSERLNKLGVQPAEDVIKSLRPPE